MSEISLILLWEAVSHPNAIHRILFLELLHCLAEERHSRSGKRIGVQNYYLNVRNKLALVPERKCKPHI